MTKRLQLDRLESRRLLSFGELPAALFGTEYDSIDAIAARPDGSFVAAGLFHSTKFTEDGPTVESSADTDIWVAGFDASGDLQWHFTFGGDADEIETDEGRADFVAWPKRAGDPFPYGVSAYPRTMGEMVSDITFDQNGNIYLAGIFRGVIELDRGDVDTTLSSNAGDDFYDSFVMKLSPGGNARSVFTFGGPFNDIVTDIEIDSENCIFVSGSFERQADFQPGKATILKEPVGRGDGFIARYTPNGKLNRFTQFGGDATDARQLDAVNDIALKPDGSVAAVGTFAYRTDFDPGPGTLIRNPGRSTNAFTLLLTSKGKLDWVQTQGDEDEFEGNRAVAIGRNGDVYTVGYFSDEVDLAPFGEDPMEFRAYDDDIDSDDAGEYTDLFLNRFDGDDGEWKLIKQIGGTGYELVSHLDVDFEGNLVLSGSFFGIADFDPSSRTAFVQTPESGNDDANVADRDNAYSGFAARYSPNLVFKNVEEVDGDNEGDVFLLGSSLDGNGNMIAGGRFNESFSVVGQTSRIHAPDVRGENEDGWLAGIEI